MAKKFKCFVRIFKTDDATIEGAFKKAMEKVYEGEEEIPFGTSLEIGEWNNTPQIEILGIGDDDRCTFCNYFRQIIGEENTKRNNCPF